ncbi:MAG: acyltransferase [Rhizobiaceae bacterium]|nr:acyltransferase [Rhizobiaceae bacterium]
MAHVVSTERQHVRTVDFARGICAVGVCAYHLLYYEQIANLDRVSFYAVYAFFVISGFALYITYRDRLGVAGEMRTYFIRRFLRIAPLFYTACVAQFLLSPQSVDGWLKAALNFLLVFGAANPGATSLVTGGWSIGIEMVFYVTLPVILALAGGRLGVLAILCGLSLLAQIVFINQLHLTGRFDWALYTQPVAFFGYFVAGCLLGEVFLRRPDLKGSMLTVPLALACALPFVIISVATTVDLLVGWVGFILTLATVGLVVAVAFMPEPKAMLRPVAIWLGRMSYPIYLIHPLAYMVTLKLLPSGGSAAQIATTLIITVVASELVNRYIERPAIGLGKRARFAT